jgi:hypothetical protein
MKALKAIEIQLNESPANSVFTHSGSKPDAWCVRIRLDVTTLKNIIYLVHLP